MALSQTDLRNASQRGQLRKSFGRLPGQRTAFLSHSHKDADLALGLQVVLREQGLDLYIDWQDASMPDRPNRETAARLQQRILIADFFLFLATSNSMSSRWCPWELGYADGKKPLDSILVVQTRDFAGNNYGSEYLDLYRHIDIATSGSLAAFKPNAPTAGVRVQNL